ncbi:MAG TPA: DUF397 domain-containing protein [Pseudonocardiaceae bacterium]|nr:DUF397 domain-containing protein [Pseudonocardiaceae bacterium]
MRQHDGGLSAYSTGAGLAWHKSTASGGGEGSNCVEAAMAATFVFVRDSKNRSGPLIAVPVPSWTAFVAVARLSSTVVMPTSA